MSARRALLGASLALVTLGVPGLLRAQPSAKKGVLHASGGSGQQALSVEIKGAVVQIGACPGGRCATPQGLAVPEPFVEGLADATLEAITLEKRRAVVRVVVPDRKAGKTWVALVAGPLQPGPPVVLFSGEADLTGAPGAQEESLVQVIEGDGKRFLVVGKRDREVHLCGRPSVLGPRMVDPSDLTLKPARVQRLSSQDRAKAQRLVAEVQESPRPGLARLLHAIGASSGLGAPGALSDGDPETSWSEAKGGDGHGEFVVFRAPKEAPLQGLRLTLKPPTKDVPRGAAPRRLYLVDDQGIFDLVLPEDGWQHPGRTYQIAFSAPRSTSCLGLVLQDAYLPPGESAPAVTLAEVEAISRLDGKASVKDLVGRLEQRGDDAREAAALLVRGGADARKAISEGYEQLSPPARFLALDAMDQGGCSESSPFFARLLASKLKEEAIHARTRIERCGRSAAPALLDALADGAHPARLAAANELALLRPGEAIPALLQADWGKNRKAFLGILAKAAGAPRGQEALRLQLQDGALPPARVLDLLRAAGEALGAPDIVPLASQALERATQAAPDFSVRYLALRPAARLALAGDAAATSMLRAASVDASVPLRSGAIEVAGMVPGLRPVVLAAAQDPEPRVRQAAALALQGQQGEAERKALLGLLGDEWTFVKSAAYDALATAGADGAVDERLRGRLKEERAPAAMARAIEAVARRRVVGAAGLLQEVARDKERPLELRSRATRALGALCHRPALDWLTDLARAGAAPMSDGEAVELGGAALVALGQLHPPDLPERLAPLLAKEAPRHASLAAQAALEETARCDNSPTWLAPR